MGRGKERGEERGGVTIVVVGGKDVIVVGKRKCKVGEIRGIKPRG